MKNWIRTLAGQNRRSTAAVDKDDAQSDNGGDQRAAESDSPSSEALPPPLGASRRASLGFRIRFVFPVCHGFPLGGVTIFDPCPIDVLNPLRTGRAPLTHPAPNRHFSPGIIVLSSSRSGPSNVPASAMDRFQGNVGSRSNSGSHSSDCAASSSVDLTDELIHGTSLASANCH